jgi:hypothetical protein
MNEMVKMDLIGRRPPAEQGTQDIGSSSYNDSDKVWRYMTFGRFAWMLMKKSLWLSRADLLGDPWEAAVSQAGLEALVAAQRWTNVDQFTSLVKTDRERTFVSCWNVSPHESYALWKIYCGTSEGVAVQTTLGRLRRSVGDLEVRPVVYGGPLPGHLADLVFRKRPAFTYENEVRIVFFKHDLAPPAGRPQPWDPEQVLENVWLFPSADRSFEETVSNLVRGFAPSLQDRICRSSMDTKPAA